MYRSFSFGKDSPLSVSILFDGFIAVTSKKANLCEDPQLLVEVGLDLQESVSYLLHLSF
jgi:hypothetical protein